MKVRIIQPDKTVKYCSKCGHDIFRQSGRNRYTNKEHTKGEHYTIRVCDKCGHKERFNIQSWELMRGCL